MKIARGLTRKCDICSEKRVYTPAILSVHLLSEIKSIDDHNGQMSWLTKSTYGIVMRDCVKQSLGSYLESDVSIFVHAEYLWFVHHRKTFDVVLVALMKITVRSVVYTWMGQRIVVSIKSSLVVILICSTVRLELVCIRALSVR